MKYMLLMILSVCLVSQDRIDPDEMFSSFTFTNSSHQINKNANDHEFIKGWNWGGDSKILDEYLNMDFNHVGVINESSIFRLDYKRANNQNLILSNLNVAGGDSYYSLTQAQSLYYEPSFNLHSNEYYKADETGAIYGFQHKSPFFEDASVTITSSSYHNYILSKDVMSSNSLSSATVLANVNCNDELKDLSYMLSNVSHTSTTFNGRELYLTLRLKSLEEINLFNESNTVLGIKMPYVATSTSFANTADPLNWVNAQAPLS